ncbi:MAG: DUF3105 domain-containing protein [Actinobacteria bacterium]|nr:DUF3105 domain-containing protein [Actinomycetota bacterium]
MADRREEREQLRQRRLDAEERERREERRRLRIACGIGGLIAAPVIAGIVILVLSAGGGSSSAAHIDPATGETNGTAADERVGTPPPAARETSLKQAAARAGCRLRLGLPGEGESHLGEGEMPPRYGTSPPTSGNHSPVPQADGAYSEAPAFENTVHSLEHGRVEIQYSPTLAEGDQLALKGLFDESPGGVLLFPDPKMPYEVAVSAWTNLVGCHSFAGSATLEVVRDFRDEFRGRGPESAAISPGA